MLAARRSGALAARRALAAAAARCKADNSGSGGNDGTLARLHAHFGAIYGERWPRLWAAMQSRTQHVAWTNPWLLAAGAEVPQGWHRAGGFPGLPVFMLPADEQAAAQRQQQQAEDDAEEQSTGGAEGEGGAAAKGSSDEQQQQQQQGEQRRQQQKLSYLLDPASLYPPLALAPRPGERVLDMCAAPGGKSLVLAAQLFGGVPVNPGSGGGGGSGRWEQAQAAAAASGSLVCNERSRARRASLTHVLRCYLPPAVIDARAVTVAGRDASRWPATEWGAYDAVLLDAPCSSERHLAQRLAAGRPLARADWSPSRTKRNADAQLVLLLSGLKLLAPGGRLVYSTCSVAPVENDGVVARALAKAAGLGARAVPPSGSWPAALLGGGCGGAEAAAAATAAGCEATEHGMLALPDKAGCGPLYWAVLEVPGK